MSESHQEHGEMTGRDRMVAALNFRQPDRPPHFETMFEVEQEAFGLQFPHRSRWANCSGTEKTALIAACMDIYERIVETYRWDALAVFWPWSDPDGVRAACRRLGSGTMIGSIVGGSVWSIEAVQDWMQFSLDIHEHPERIHQAARAMRDRACTKIDQLADAGAEFVVLVNDIAGNLGTFIDPNHVRRFILPYLAEEVARIHDRGMYAFIHTDGNIMSILPDWIAVNADCFVSVDPMAGMDIAVVEDQCRERMALMGNVQCSLLQDGPFAAIEASARYCLDHAAPGGGYIFASSNTIFPGMPLCNYQFMLRVFDAWVAEQC